MTVFDDQRSTYRPRDFYDDYVLRSFPARKQASGAPWAWPGDEWASETVRQNTFSLLLEPPLGRGWGEIIEIGPGSGKYTELMLQDPNSRVTAFEISPAFLDSLLRRCASAVQTGRLDARQIDWSENDGLLRRTKSLQGALDLYCAVDVFLMMDFQASFVHLLTAARLLRVGGRFAATFGDADSDSGFDRLFRDAGRHSAFDGQLDTRFHWVSAALLCRCFDELGFKIVQSVSGPDGREHGELDVARRYVVAELVDRRPAETLASRLSWDV